MCECNNLTVKLIAFYLPQFHQIPENDKWWGKGFTEWVSVKSASPQFEGHYQPHVPGELGYYDLSNIAVQQRQVELAKIYGLGGFCFYFYWFAGKRLLEKPTLNYLENTELDLPFCLCWANENWTRAWDGLENDILIAQDYSASDDLAFIEYVSKYLKDERYIKVDGKPLLVVYRPNLLPTPIETVARWRKWCRENGIGEIYLASTQSFDVIDPRSYGFDVAIEFPPNNTAPDIITDKMPSLNKDFSGFVYDWNSIAQRSDNYVKPHYPLFRTVNPDWDNTARRKAGGAIFNGSTPKRYEDWLVNAALDTVDRIPSVSQRLVFVNAWNEWAEGAHLEPDEKYGYAYLQATRNALERASTQISDRKIILVAHDAHPHGAQYLVLNIAKTFTSELGVEVDLVVLGPGVLMDEYKKWATVHQLINVDPLGVEARNLVQKLVSKGHRAAIVNTTVSGLFLETLSNAGLRCVALIHELYSVIVDNNLQPNALAIATHADKVVFAAEQVLESFKKIADLPAEKIELRYQGLYKRNEFRGQTDQAKSTLRKELDLKADSRIVLGIGYLDHRKGVDLFVEAGLNVLQEAPDAYFVWVGHWEMNMEVQIRERLEGHELADHFIFPGRKDNTDIYYAGADIFVLSSREDPFPSTVMEALEVGTPVIGFSGAGGFENLLRQDCGLLVPLGDVNGLSHAILELLNVPEKVKRLGAHGANLIQQTFSFRHYLYDLLDLAQQPLMRVSAVVPNYNYARHLEQRLNSIFSQTYPIFEIIVLDDASTDNSLEVIENCLAKTEIDCRLIVNEENSGSVFKQWQKAAESAKGDFVWICEADDFCDPRFVERTIEPFTDERLVLTYAQSKQVDEDGKVASNDYLSYTDDICIEKWKKDYVCGGKEELARALAVKNTIPNVSAVIFRKEALRESIDRCHEGLSKLTIAGDWYLYGDILQYGRIGFISESLNSHRRHDSSVTISTANNERHIAEIIYMQGQISSLVDLEADTIQKAKRFERHAIDYLGQAKH